MQIFVQFLKKKSRNVPSSHAVLGIFMCKCLCWLIDSRNVIMKAITEPTQSDSSDDLL